MNQNNIIIKNSNGSISVPDNPVIPFIEGDGTGPDIWRASRMVLDAAVSISYKGGKKISWLEIYAGEKCFKKTGQWITKETFDAIKKYIVAIKGPLTTPVGEGMRSLNVLLRQKLDLYACIRPVKYIDPVPSPVKNPQKINMVVFRENTEDVYAGIEWESGSDASKKVISFLKNQMNVVLPENPGIGIKPISEKNSKRLVAAAISHALERNLKSVTLMHKGNIMKFTEGAFMRWGYEVAKEEFGDKTVTEEELGWVSYDKYPEGKLVIKDRIADMLFQQILLRPDEFDVIATTNLNGDYISDALAAQAGGLGMAPGANIGDECAVFEATHGTAPKYSGLDKVNPGSLILSGAMMLDYIEWTQAADLVRHALQTTVKQGAVTYDLARQIAGAKEVKCSEFAKLIIDNMSRHSL